MRTIGLIVEGPFDGAALQELVRRCSVVATTIISRPCGGKERLFSRFPGFLEEFRYIKEGSNVDKALVVCDAHQKDPEGEIKRLANRIATRKYPFPIKYCVIVQEIEAWLLANEVVDPEGLVDPKTELENRLSVKGISYTQEVARRLASGINLETLQHRCHSFQAFPQSVINGQAGGALKI